MNSGAPLTCQPIVLLEFKKQWVEEHYLFFSQLAIIIII
jgi:hypothetical protein